MSVEELRNLLKSVPTGLIHVDLRVEVVGRLAKCWSSLSGSSDTSMTEQKVTCARLEDLTWNSPVLSFVIERHGGTVQGSKSGELQGWIIDLDLNEAFSNSAGRRRLQKFAPKLDVQALAAELFRVIQRGAKDVRLTWKSDTVVKINVSVVIPTGPAIQTTQGRRKRFRAALEPLMKTAGWCRRPSGTQLLFERNRQP